jgi:hypothetical protein
VNLYGLRCFMWLMLMLMSGICANRHLWIQSSLPRKKIAIPGAKKRRRDRISSDTGRMCSRAVRISKASASKLASLRWQGQACPENNVIPEPSICWKNCLAKKTFKKNVEALEIIRAWFYKKCPHETRIIQDHPGWPRNNSPFASRRWGFTHRSRPDCPGVPLNRTSSTPPLPAANLVAPASLWHLYGIYIYTLWLFNIAMGNGP